MLYKLINVIYCNKCHKTYWFNDYQKHIVNCNAIKKHKNNKIIILQVIDEGEGFREKDTSKIFKRFYSNRPEIFGEHSGLGLNIVKNLVELHNGQISAINNKSKGAKIKIIFPEA